MMQKPTDKSLGEMVLAPVFQQTKEGIHTISVWGCRDDGIKDSMMALAKRMLTYAKIERYNFSIDTYINATEAYAIIGMKGPQ